MIRAVFFDMGGTLDGDGLHWLDRFVDLYARAGLTLPREQVRAAFDAAEGQASRSDGISSTGLDEMVRCHVEWQFAHLEARTVQLPNAASIGREICSAFTRDVRTAAAANGRLLARLHADGVRLGIVSNGCGNVGTLCDDLGYSPFLSFVVDSRRVGLYKPDPAIYHLAVSRIGLPASSILMVGDSFERDIVPAKTIGMQTAWLMGSVERECPEPSRVDIYLRNLADLPGALDARSRTVA